MAFQPDRWILVVTFMDNSGKTTSRSYQINPQGADAEALAASAEDIVADTLAALGGVTECEISKYFYYRENVEDTLAIPASGVQKENTLQMSFTIEDHPQKSGNVNIPGPVIGVFTATSGRGADIMDTGDAAIITLRDLFISTPPSILISDGENADVLLGGHRLHKANPNS